jgi:hypothetical protein
MTHSVEAVAGGVYSVMRGSEKIYGVVKVLGMGPGAVNARIFDRCADVRPELAWFDNPEERAPGQLDEALGIGIGLLPVTPRVFAYWKPKLLFTQALTDEEQQLLGEYGNAGQPWDDLKYP